LAKQVGSDDESQISDVDPSQLAKMVEVSVSVFDKSWLVYHQTAVGKSIEHAAKSNIPKSPLLKLHVC
jgi:hypothetical protein